MWRNISKSLAVNLMEKYPSRPAEDDISLWEIFRHKNYTQATADEQNKIKLLSAKFRYNNEKENGFFETYFPNFSTDELHGKSILDLGCFTGGRLVRWAELYDLSEARGIDINPLFAEAGEAFAKEKGINASFATGFAESLPYDSNYFDFIVNFDVFEHVRNVEQVMNECFRILKPNGKLMAVFPPFYQPAEAHLGKVTSMPAMQWLFSGKTISDAYNEVIKKRGNEAYWYAREDPELEKWEKTPTLNGITVRKFRRIVTNNKSWKILYWGTEPILSGGSRSDKKLFRILERLFVVPARLPVLEELFLGRICVSLEKTEN